MKKEDKIEVAPEIVAFFDLVVSEAFTTIKNKHLNNSAYSKTRIDKDSAELFIFHDPESDKRGFHYILQFQDGILWRRSFYTNWMGETPDIDNELVSDDFSETTAEFIVVDFVTEYREDWPTKPLGEPPAES
jgi:hypothetical protein